MVMYNRRFFDVPEIERHHCLSRQVSYTHESCTDVRSQNAYTRVRISGNVVYRELCIADEYDINDTQSNSDKSDEFVLDYKLEEFDAAHDAWTLQNCLSGKLETELEFLSNSLLKHQPSPTDVHHIYVDASNLLIRDWLDMSRPEPFGTQFQINKIRDRATGNLIEEEQPLDSENLVCTMFRQPRLLFLERAVRQHYDITSMTWQTDGSTHDDAIEEIDDNSALLSDSAYNAKVDLAVMTPTLFDFFASDLWYSRELVTTVFTYWRNYADIDPARHNGALKQNTLRMLPWRNDDNTRWRLTEIARNFFQKVPYLTAFTALRISLDKKIVRNDKGEFVTNDKGEFTTRKTASTNLYPPKQSQEATTGLKFLQNRLVRRLWFTIIMRDEIDGGRDETKATEIVQNYVSACHDQNMKRLCRAYRWKRLMITALMFRKLMILQLLLTEHKNDSGANVMTSEPTYEFNDEKLESAIFEDYAKRWLEQAKAAYSSQASDDKLKVWSCTRKGMEKMSDDVTKQNVDVLFEPLMFLALSTSRHKTNKESLKWLCSSKTTGGLTSAMEAAQSKLREYALLSMNLQNKQDLPSQFYTHCIESESKVKFVKSLME